MGNVFRLINSNGDIEITMYKKANAVFKTNEYNETDNICTYKETINIFNLLQENYELKIQISAREEVCNRLESNWNKLKESIRKSLEAIDTIQKLTGNAIENYTPRILTYNQIKDKMQELEKRNSDE